MEKKHSNELLKNIDTKNKIIEKLEEELKTLLHKKEKSENKLSQCQNKLEVS